MKPRRDDAACRFFSSHTNRKVTHHKILSPINEESIMWHSLKSCEKLTHICCLSWQSHTISRGVERIYLCMRSHSRSNTQFTADPRSVLPKSRLCRFSWHHRAFAVCSFSDIWGLSTPRGVVRRAVDGKHSQPAHQTCRLEQICHVKRNREEGKTGVVRGQYGSSVFYNPVLLPCNILSIKACSWKCTKGFKIYLS